MDLNKPPWGNSVVIMFKNGFFSRFVITICVSNEETIIEALVAFS